MTSADIKQLSGIRWIRTSTFVNSQNIFEVQTSTDPQERWFINLNTAHNERSKMRSIAVTYSGFRNVRKIIAYNNITIDTIYVIYLKLFEMQNGFSPQPTASFPFQIGKQKQCRTWYHDRDCTHRIYNTGTGRVVGTSLPIRHILHSRLFYDLERIPFFPLKTNFIFCLNIYRAIYEPVKICGN